MTYGVTPDGFTPKSKEQIETELAAHNRANIDPLIGVSGDDPITKLNSIVAGHLADLWSLAGRLYETQDPANATGARLESACAITGTQRLPPERGEVGLVLTLGPHATLPAGLVAGVDGQPGSQWVTEGTATNATAGNLDVPVIAHASQPGRFEAPAHLVTRIMSPTSGWLGVTNPLDATPGRDLETDDELRTRRADELEPRGSTQLQAIVTTLRELKSSLGRHILASVDGAENTSSYRDHDGRPPHSIELTLIPGSGIFDPGAQDLVGQTMWACKPAGIGYYGTGSDPIEIVDSMGLRRSLPFSGATDVLVWIGIVGLVVDPGTYPGDAALAEHLVEWGRLHAAAGQTIIRWKVMAEVLRFAGVLDLATLVIGPGYAVTSEQNLSIPDRSIARFDTSRIQRFDSLPVTFVT